MKKILRQGVLWWCNEMEAGLLFWLLFSIMLPSIMLPSLVVAQTTYNAKPAELASHSGASANDAFIIKFDVVKDGSLHIVYSDGIDVSIPKERGRFDDGEHTLTQENFLDIQVADDRQHIGWLADYMICSQNYPCAAELAIYRSGQAMRYIPPPYGTMWDWKFLHGGKQVVIQGGFPHGDDTGAYALYDTETGRKLAKYSPTEKNAPEWVLELQSSK